jgi:hypothetical protein
MGQIRFLVPNRERVSPTAIETAHCSGRDHLPFIGRTATGANGELIVDRDDSESGVFNILWPLAERGNLLLSTATLVERPDPYHLPLELARGTLNRLRNLLADWEASALIVPDQVRADVAESLSAFVQAAATQSQPAVSAESAERSIHSSLAAIDVMAGSIVEQVSQARQRQNYKIVPLFAGRMGDALPEGPIGVAFSAAFNSAAVPFSWGRVEADEGRQNWALYDAQMHWCQSRGLRIGGGPLLELQRRSLPDWIYLWEGDFDNLLMVAGDYVRAVVSRYKGKVHFWNAAGRLITGEALGLDEEQKLRLVAKAVEVIRGIDQTTPVIVSFDQPWAEYMSRRESDLNPIQFADALVRSDLGVAGIGLEIDIGLGPKNTLPRDPLEFNSQLDRWSGLGLPLLVSMTIPSAEGGFSPELQQRWLEAYVPLILARPTVQAFFWAQLKDAETGDFPHTGLVDAQGRLKPAFSALATLRKRYSA